MALELTPLGTNGFFPSFGRQTMSFLLRRPGDARALLLDAGTGVGRLFSTHWRLLDGVERLEVLLTHYHLDHTAGLASTSHAWSGALVIHAPVTPLVDVDDAEEALHRLLSPPLFPVPLREFASRPEIRPYGEAPALDFDLELRVRRQRHGGGSVGVRLGDRLAYVTDTAEDPETAEFAADVGWLLHELWVTDEEGEENPDLVRGHSSIGQVAGLADAARAGVLSPIHHRPDRTDTDLERMRRELAARCSVPVRWLEEGATVALP